MYCVSALWWLSGFVLLVTRVTSIVPPSLVGLVGVCLCMCFWVWVTDCCWFVSGRDSEYPLIVDELGELSNTGSNFGWW